MKIDKNAALDRLKEIESETKELRKIIEAADKPKTIFERVYDLKSAIKELGEGDSTIIEYRKMLSNNTPKKYICSQEIEIFAKAMNEGTKMNYTNENQTKYFPWFDVRNEVGSGFFSSVCYVWFYDSRGFSACHAYSTSEKAKHGGKCIEQIYYDYIVG